MGVPFVISLSLPTRAIFTTCRVADPEISWKFSKSIFVASAFVFLLVLPRHDYCNSLNSLKSTTVFLWRSSNCTKEKLRTDNVSPQFSLMTFLLQNTTQDSFLFLALHAVWFHQPRLLFSPEIAFFFLLRYREAKAISKVTFFLHKVQYSL